MNTMQGIQYKAVDTQAQPVDVNDLGNGVIEAIVSITNVKDNVNDVILPGAYEKSLRTRTPKGVWHHSWTDPIAKTLDIKELQPGDSLLPTTMSDGSPWPDDAGALYVKMEFNLNTDKGRNAYEDVKFFGDNQEWSIGYKVPEKKSYRRNGVRYIEELDLYEYSPVLFGAMSHARTATVKDAQLAYKSLASGLADDDTTEDEDIYMNTKNTDLLVEVKAALSTFADQFYDIIGKVAELSEVMSAQAKSDDRQGVLDIASSLGLDEDDFNAFHESVDDGDEDAAEEKALHLANDIERKSGVGAVRLMEHLGLELKSMSEDEDEDEDDDDWDEPDDDDYEDDDEGDDYDDEEDEDEGKMKKKSADAEFKSIALSDFSQYL